MHWDSSGFELVELIGFGLLGEVWQAVDRTSGQVVALRRLGAGDVLEEVRRREAVLRALPGDHLIRVRSVTDGAVVLDHAAGGSLAALLARRGPLTPGEVVTVVAPIAQALAAAHARGLSHGRVSAREVLLTREGKPRLDGLALSFLYDAQPSQAGDVQALRELARGLLEGSAGPDEATLAIHQALQAPTAAELGEALLGSCRAQPLTGLTPPDPPVLLPPSVRALDRARRRRRGPAVLGVLTGLLALGAGASLLGGPGPGQPAHSGAPAAEPEPDWRQVLEGLDRARAAAFAAGDQRALAQVYVAGSAALRADQLAIERLVDAHLTAHGLRHVLHAVQVGSRTSDQAELLVWQAMSGYDLVAADGGVRHRAAGAEVRRRVVLRRTGERWLVESLAI